MQKHTIYLIATCVSAVLVTSQLRTPALKTDHLPVTSELQNQHINKNAAKHELIGGSHLSTLTDTEKSAQINLPVFEDDPAILDAQAYAEKFSITEDEALMRLYIQDKLGLIEENIAQAKPKSFAGLWIEHEPEYRIIVQTTSEETSTLPSYFDSLGQNIPIKIVTVDTPLYKLESSLDKISQDLYNAEIQADINIDIFNNRPEIMVADVDAFENLLKEHNIILPANTHIREVEALTYPVTNIEGGRPLFNCSTGFIVYSYWKAEYGISTAGHCSNHQVYSYGAFVALDFEAEQYGGNADIQWHTPKFNSSSNNFTNKIWEGSYLISIWSSKYRNYQTIGSWVRRYGQTSGSAWGTILTKYYRPNVHPGIHFTHNFMKATFSASPGDSGGPVFSGSAAYGITMTSNGVYTAIDYLGNLGLQVKTW